MLPITNSTVRHGACLFRKLAETSCQLAWLFAARHSLRKPAACGYEGRLDSTKRQDPVAGVDCFNKPGWCILLSRNQKVYKNPSAGYANVTKSRVGPRFECIL